MQCYCKETGEEFAVKIVRSHINVNEEVLMLHECQGHPNIVLLNELLRDEKYIYIVTELIIGSELHDYKGISPDDVKFIFNQLVSAVYFIHSKNIAHRDIKMENILVSYSHPKTVTIIDFGFATRQSDDTVLTQACFTLDYVAPEILQNVPYTRQCDVWSLGVILYFLLCGDAPFRPHDFGSAEQNINQIASKILRGSYTESYSWSKIPKSAKNLIKRMLVVNQKDRIKIEDVMNHEWLRKAKKIPATMTCSSYHSSITTKAIINSKINELSHAYDTIIKESLIIDDPINNNNREDGSSSSFSLNLSEDDEKDTMFNDSTASDLWDEDFNGFDDTDDFIGFDLSEMKINNKLDDLIKKLSKPMYTTSIIGETVKTGRKVRETVNKIKAAVKPKQTRNTRGRKVIEAVIPIEIPVKTEETIELRRTGRIKKQVVTINPDDVLNWNDESEINFDDIKPKKIRKGAKRRNEIDDRDWLNSSSSKRRK